MARLSPSQEDIYAVSTLHAHVTSWFQKNWAGTWLHHGAHFDGFEKIHNKSSFFEDVREAIDQRLTEKYGLMAASKKAISIDSIRRFLLQSKSSFDDKVMEAFLALTDPELSWSEYRERVLTHKPVSHTPSRLPRQIAAALMLIVFLAAGGWYFQKREKNGDFSFSAEVSTSQGFPKTTRISYALENMKYKTAWIFADNEKINLTDAKGELSLNSFMPKKSCIKLFLDDRMVKEIVLAVPSDGWYGSINNRIPLPKESFMQNGILQFTGSHNTGRVYEEPYISFMYFSAFKMDADKLTLTADVINNAETGGIWAYDVSVDVLGTEGNMTFNLLSPDAVIYSKLKVAHTDLSAGNGSHLLSRLGVKLSDWSALEVITRDHTFRISLNGKVLVEEKYEGNLGSLTGVQFYLKGSGAIKNVRLQEPGKAPVPL